MTGPAQAILDVLRHLHVEFEVIPIDPAFADTIAFCQKYGYPLDRSANTIIVASRREPIRYAACVVLATTRLDVNKRVRKLMGVSRASFASPGQMEALTGMQVGGVTPLALPEDLPLYVDERVMQAEWIIVGGGGRDSKIRTSPEILTKLRAQVVPDLAIAGPVD
ncbi:MAG: YbaK/EbsC family protein [Acidobacteriota bacterium]